MKPILLFILSLALLTACQSQPAYTDNGNPGQLTAVVFYDDNNNGAMDNGESGTPGKVAIAQEVSCPPINDPNWVDTDSSGVLLFEDLKPGKYCVFPFSNGLSMTTKMTQEVYVSSDALTTVTFGIVR